MKKFIIVLYIFLIAVPLLKAETYNLDQFLKLVEQHSKDLKLASEDKAMAKAQKKEAVSTALPKIAFEAGYTRNLSDYFMYIDMAALTGGGGAQKFKVNRSNEYTASVALQQTLFSPSVGSAIKAAKQYEKLTNFVYKASWQNINTAAKKLFYQALLLEKVWRVNQEAEGNALDNYKNMQLKFDNGVVSEFELLQSKVRWKNAIPATAEAKRNYELVLNNLKNWAGIPVQETLELDGGFDDIPQIPEMVDIPSVLSLRPDFNALKWEEKLRETNVQANKASFYPSLIGQFVYNYSAQSNEFKLDEQNELYMAGVNLSLPIFTGGYRRAQVQKAKIDLNKTRIRINQTKEDIYNETTNIYLRLKEAHERIYSAEATLEAAQKAFHIAENTAQSGLATQLQLKDARVGYDQAKLNYYAGIFDYLNAYFDWQLATGQVNSIEN